MGFPAQKRRTSPPRGGLRPASAIGKRNAVPDLISGVRVGIDVGGPKTQVRAALDAETVLADGVCPSEGWQPAGHARAAAFLPGLIRRTVPDGAGLAAVVV